ncbi:Response regulator [Sulfidibacter corallicola]|uniref:histidine kinase n=1 Tax=Sulfidibacter corallicola TaxID=2818388 RepID=A0A8A4TX64_SULCO|nr:response regulator [Sulfidibacter corallicola]QTD53788.1 response regulator [Sulfidibacter corallicola]
MKVLVAEDDRVSLKVLERFLEKWGHQPLTCENGLDAWNLVSEQKDIEMGLVDWMMPGLDGLELVRRIRSSERSTPFHVILITAKSEKKDMLTAFEAGADDFLVKPVDPMELNSRIKVGSRLVESQKQLYLKNVALTKAVTEMEDLAEQRARMLLHADRLASLGVLTAGIAHEINNPTTFISGNAQTLERCWPLVERTLKSKAESTPERDRRKIDLVLTEIPKMLSGIRNGVERISAIINGLKTYSRKDREHFEPVDLNQCVHRALILCGNRLNHLEAEVVLELDTDLPNTRGNAQKLEQVLVNLIVNAADAMEELTGRVRPRLVFRTSFDPMHTELTVTDNGVGIPPEKLPDIWNPFFTSKDVGKGTGLGLSISQGIIEDHKGTITAENAAKGGTRFTIRLPKAVPDSTDDREAGAS